MGNGAEEVSREKKRKLANQVLSLSRDSILVSLRFLDTALSSLRFQADDRENLFLAADGRTVFFNPVWVLKQYQREPRYISRCLLHVLFHCIFHHNFQYQKLDAQAWDLAADLAVEEAILELELPGVTLPRDPDLRRRLSALREEAGGLTADRLYRYFRRAQPSDAWREEMADLFRRDQHFLWKPREELLVTEEQWRKISERVRTELKSFTESHKNKEALQENLQEAVKDRYDYGEILRRFMVTGEDVRVNDEEFDYIYYHYGLEHYGNLPLIEPLEYREIPGIREFVIAIDTSASCRGNIVKAFLRKTCSILMSEELFFSRTNVHILQCDSQIQGDVKVTNQEELEHFLLHGKLQGFGATDFRPVFDYVEELREKKEFENLKGLIYFTDGYGIYPERMPDYEVIFAFLNEDENRAPVPPWSVKVVLEEEELERARQQEEEWEKSRQQGNEADVKEDLHEH